MAKCRRFLHPPGWVLLALQNAFQKLGMRRISRKRGGKPFPTARYRHKRRHRGALRDPSIPGTDPARWIFPLLACRPLAECGALRPRPPEYGPDDVLELAEALLT